jgi:hypothetical protein
VGLRSELTISMYIIQQYSDPGETGQKTQPGGQSESSTEDEIQLNDNFGRLWIDPAGPEGSFEYGPDEREVYTFDSEGEDNNRDMVSNVDERS